MVTAKPLLSYPQLRQLIAHFPPVEDPMVAALTTQTGWQLLQENPPKPQLSLNPCVSTTRRT